MRVATKGCPMCGDPDLIDVRLPHDRHDSPGHACKWLLVIDTSTVFVDDEPVVTVTHEEHHLCTDLPYDSCVDQAAELIQGEGLPFTHASDSGVVHFSDVLARCEDGVTMMRSAQLCGFTRKEGGLVAQAVREWWQATFDSVSIDDDYKVAVLS